MDWGKNKSKIVVNNLITTKSAGIFGPLIAFNRAAEAKQFLCHRKFFRTSAVDRRTTLLVNDIKSKT